MDKAQLFEDLTWIRRNTRHEAILRVCDALFAQLTGHVTPVAQPVVTLQASADCPECAKHRKGVAARVTKHRNQKRKGATSRQSKGALRPIIPKANNAPAAFPAGDKSATPVTKGQQTP